MSDELRDDDVLLQAEQTPPQPAAPQTTTPAPQDEEANYQTWLKGHNLREDPDYDMRGAFKAGEQPDERGHMTDKYKRPSHPTFSEESVYHDDKNRGGRWTKTGDGKWAFAPGPANLKGGGIERVKKYLGESDPDVQLLPPTPSTGAPSNVPATPDHPGYAEHDPDEVPTVEIAHDGNKYVAPQRGKPVEFDEAAPEPNPFRQFEADAAKLPPKDRAAVQSVLKAKIAAYDKNVAGYTARKKAHDTSEQQRTAKEAAEADKGMRKSMAHYDQSVKPRELAAMKTDIETAFDAANERAKTGGKEPDKVTDEDKTNYARSQFAGNGVAPDKFKQIALSLMTTNPNMTAERAVRMTHQLTLADDNDATFRNYKPHGRDITQSKNVVVSTPKFGAVHVNPQTYKDITDTVKAYHLGLKGAKATADKEKVDTSKPGPISGKDVKRTVEYMLPLPHNTGANNFYQDTMIPPAKAGLALSRGVRRGVVELGNAYDRRALPLAPSPTNPGAGPPTMGVPLMRDFRAGRGT